jgi:hypothetical protein
VVHSFYLKKIRNRHDYLRTLQTPAYQGETGKTLEDFMTKFLIFSTFSSPF